MKGGIYSEQKCPLCGGIFKDDRKGALICNKHPEQKATKFRVYFQGTTKRFSSYTEAFRHLTGLRFKSDEGSFDPREYKKSNPLGFENLSSLWLELKEKEVKRKTYKCLSDHIFKAVQLWHNRNVKEITLKDFQIFLNSYYNHSTKSKHNYLQTLKQFWKWLYDCGEIDKMPMFPKVDFELSWRNTIDKKTQRKIIDEVYRISNLKTWLAIKWLATYFNVRPEEVRNIKEKHIDVKAGEILIPHPKEKRPKFIFLLPEDVKIIKSQPRGLPELYFFRHKNGEQFGQKNLYKWWKRACKNLGVEGIDLYGGTRHSTVRDLRKYRTPEEIRFGSMHSTNKAFERYFRFEGDDLRAIYRDTQGGKKLAKKFSRA